MAWKDRAATSQARNLRMNATEPERRLWQVIRNRQLSGVRFNRQVRIGPFICDFAARSAGIVIEIDGGLHSSSLEFDSQRTAYLEANGYHVVRFWNHDVMENLDGVVRALELTLQALPQPLPQAGGE